jgi:hypothetical protein
MSSDLDAIIEAAPAWWDAESLIEHGYEVYPEDVDFIATFDPQHVALMEAVVKAARYGIATSQTHALDAYRKEHGYE